MMLILRVQMNLSIASNACRLNPSNDLFIRCPFLRQKRWIFTAIQLSSQTIPVLHSSSSSRIIIIIAVSPLPNLPARLVLVKEILAHASVPLVLRRQIQRLQRGARPEHHRPGADARSPVVEDGDQGEEECLGVGFEAEDPEGADDARDAEVVVVEARDPVKGGGGEVGAGGD